MSRLTVHPLVRSLSSKQLRSYCYHYIDITPIMDDVTRRIGKSFGGFCADCPSLSVDIDTGAENCPAAFDYLDNDCYHWYDINYYLEWLVSVDLVLREMFGDNPDIPSEWNTLEVH